MHPHLSLCESSGMTLLSVKEAAATLRISVRLLRWLSRYSPKKDGRKLSVTETGEVEEEEVRSFDAYLWEDWGTRYVPKGIEVELRVEARGHCGLCDRPCAQLEMAHIKRKGREISHYSQHPHNLLNLCGGCHNRYDSDGDNSIDLTVVQHAKERSLSVLMEAVMRDVELARASQLAIRENVAKEVARALQELPALQIQSPLPSPEFWAGQARVIFRVTELPEASGISPTDVSTPAQFKDAVAQAAKFFEVNQPATSGVLNHYSQNVFSPDYPQQSEVPWDYLPEPPEPRPHECQAGCGESAMIDVISCSACHKESWEASDDESYTAEYLVKDGSYRIWSSNDGPRGDTHEAIECRDCGNDEMEVEFGSFCSYHKHIFNKED